MTMAIYLNEMNVIKGREYFCTVSLFYIFQDCPTKLDNRELTVLEYALKYTYLVVISTFVWTKHNSVRGFVM